MLILNSGRTLYYGKGDVLVYRTYANPIRVEPLPESSYVGNSNVIFAHNIKFAVSSEELLSSFTEGDNAMIVATDSMKNFILRQTANYDGSTTEGLLAFISEQFMERYEYITAIDISAQRLPFDAVSVPGETGEFSASPLVYSRGRNELSGATLRWVRTQGGGVMERHRCTLHELQLIKVSGSSFYGFVRDEYTTLPESFDRPLYIFLDISWQYTDDASMLDGDLGKYVAAEQIRDIAQTVFHEMNTPSIQHLIWHVGLRILTRFPQIAEIQFESNNRTWEGVVEPVDGTSPGVFTEPRPPYGFQGFSLTRADLKVATEAGQL
ncbi:uricase [Paenibacillus swuensis]|uniref:Uricase n=1 Tax=Paenibacillus swuensis TaxID=1178515 RepID=A0A172TL04_9BACL|nr:urate oxidase [Paenibacillus swuensis]ANE47656.1 uricase [Paenibacillus swuensis]